MIKFVKWALIFSNITNANSFLNFKFVNLKLYPKHFLKITSLTYSMKMKYVLSIFTRMHELFTLLNSDILRPEPKMCEYCVCFKFFIRQNRCQLFSCVCLLICCPDLWNNWTQRECLACFWLVTCYQFYHAVILFVTWSSVYPNLGLQHTRASLVCDNNFCGGQALELVS